MHFIACNSKLKLVSFIAASEYTGSQESGAGQEDKRLAAKLAIFKMIANPICKWAILIPVH